jgi:hypothetical protein
LLLPQKFPGNAPTLGSRLGSEPKNLLASRENPKNEDYSSLKRFLDDQKEAIKKMKSDHDFEINLLKQDLASMRD